MSELPRHLVVAHVGLLQGLVDLVHCCLVCIKEPLDDVLMTAVRVRIVGEGCGHAEMKDGDYKAGGW